MSDVPTQTPKQRSYPLYTSRLDNGWLIFANQPDWLPHDNSLYLVCKDGHVNLDEMR